MMRVQELRLQSKICRRLLPALVLISLSVAGCESDCIYKLYENRDGDELCGRYCPIDDAEGNAVVDADNEPVYKLEDTVHRVNCVPPSGSSTTSTTTTDTTDTAAN